MKVVALICLPMNGVRPAKTWLAVNNKSLQEFTGDRRSLQELAGDRRSLQEIAGVCRRLQEITRVLINLI
jgi:hypothetical protein